MPNALLQQIANPPSANVAQNFLAGQQFAQQGQLNALNISNAQRAQEQQQREQDLLPVREAVAGYFLTPQEQRGAYFQQIAPQFGVDPNADHTTLLPQLIRGNPGLLGADVTQKIMERETAPEAFTAPVETSSGLVQFGSRGTARRTGFSARGQAEGQPFAATTSDGRRVFAQRFSDGTVREVPDFSPPPEKNAGRLPATAHKQEQEDIELIQISSNINTDLAEFENKIKNGQLRLGFVENQTARAKNASGFSDESSRNFASFVAMLNKLRNDSLRLNKGVQTEGDAQRAWEELIASLNDPRVVLQRLTEIRGINQRAAQQKALAIESRRANFGVTQEFDPAAVVGADSPFAGDGQQTIQFGGETYVKRGGQWFKQ